MLVRCSKSNSYQTPWCSAKTWSINSERLITINGPTTNMEESATCSTSTRAVTELFHACTEDAPVLNHPSPLRCFSRFWCRIQMHRLTDLLTRLPRTSHTVTLHDWSRWQPVVVVSSQHLVNQNGQLKFNMLNSMYRQLVKLPPSTRDETARLMFDSKDH